MSRKISMILQMTVVNAPMDITVHKNIILLLVSLVTQVNTVHEHTTMLSIASSDQNGRGESNCKICERSRYTNENARRYSTKTQVVAISHR